jgi:hypothetical protein
VALAGGLEEGHEDEEEMGPVEEPAATESPLPAGAQTLTPVRATPAFTG